MYYEKRNTKIANHAIGCVSYVSIVCNSLQNMMMGEERVRTKQMELLIVWVIKIANVQRTKTLKRAWRGNDG